MVQGGLGLYHFHKRKRIHQGYESHHHPEISKRLIDKLIYVVAVLGPIMTIPQLIKIWVDKNAAGVSVLSWSSYLVIAIFWLIYGIVHKEKPLIITYTLWIILEAFIVIGVTLY